MPQPHALTEHVEIVKRRLAALTGGGGTRAEAVPVVEEAIEALEVSLEEMQITGEELRVQNEELATSRELLEAERRRYRELFEDAPDAYLVTSGDGRIHEANTAAGTLFDLPARYLPGKPVTAFVDADVLRPFRLELARARALPRREGWDFRIARRDGTYRDVSATVTAARDPVRDAPTLRWILRDVTDLRRAAEAERRAAAAEADRAEAARRRAFLEAVLEQMPAGVLVAHADGTLAARNAHAECLAGAALPAGGDPVPHADALPGWRPAAGGALAPEAFPLSRALRGERVEGEDFGYARDDGTRATLRVNAAPVRDGDGAIVAAVAAFTDVTRRLRAEARDRVLAGASATLAGSLEYGETLRRVARISTDAMATLCLVHVAERDGVRVRALAHRDAEAEAGLWSLVRPFPGSDDGHGPNPVFRALRTGEPQLLPAVDEADVAAMADTAEQFNALHRLAPRSMLVVPLLARGATLGALTLVRTGEMPPFDDEDAEVAGDLAARAALALDNARLYADSDRAARAREDMLAVVSHDLRNPIQAVLISAVLLRDFPARPYDAREARQIDIIHRSAEQMTRLVDDLVEIAALEGSGPSLRCAPVQPEPLLDTAVAMIGATAEAASVAVVRAPSPPLPPVHADAERVLQVLGNLLANAVRFTPEGGTVTVSAAAEGDAVCVRVADAGPGIAPEHLPHVFDRFWQVRSARRTAGLGLAIARTLVEAHGGRVGVESTPGVGSVFWITLPVAKPDASGEGG